MPKDGKKIVFVSITVDKPSAVPHGDYFHAEPSVSWVAGAITEPKWQVFIIDADNESDELVLQKIFDFEVSVVGFSCHTAGYPRGLKLAELIKRSSPEIFILFGGWHPSVVPDDVLNEPWIDAVGVGSGERFINSFLQNPENFRGKVIRAESFPFVQRLAPKRNLNFHQAVFNFFGSPPQNRQHAASIVIGNGGCSFSCSYCCTPVIYPKLEAARNLEVILSEVEELIDKYEVNDLFIRDENPVLFDSLLENLCDAFIDRGYNNKISIHSFGDVRLMTPGLLKKMASAGWKGLLYGVESFNVNQLHSFHRDTNLEMITNVFRWTREAGIFSTASLILWKPGDSIKSFDETLNALRVLLPDEVLAVFYVPFPGTEHSLKWQNIPMRTNKFEDYNLMIPILQIDPSITTEKLVFLRKRMLINYYLSSEYRGLVDFRMEQFGNKFYELTELRRSRMFKRGIDIWRLNKIRNHDKLKSLSY